MELSDVEWGDVISDKDGVLVVRGRVDDVPVVVKRYARPEHTREIRNYALLMALGVPTLEVVGSGDDWLALVDVAATDLRLATEADMADPGIAVLLARWYDELHSAGMGIPGLADMYDETAVVDEAGLAQVAARWPELAPGVATVLPRLRQWRAVLAALPRTLTYNDFFHGNATVARDGSRALMFDLNYLGAGHRWGDLRNVMTGLEPAAAEAFRAEYERLQSARGVPLDPREREVDVPLSHLAALVLVSSRDAFPAWAEDSAEWLRSQA